jgi:BirA family biotin operon repressor/biotin-[acetyl-CoA-carboxylase] ligase
MMTRIMSAGALQVDRLRTGLRTQRVGRRVEYIPATTSTNDEALQRIDDADADGLVIFTEYQTAGRGRLGRRWLSPRGASLLCSLLLIEKDNSFSGGDLVLLSAVAVADAIVACTGVAVSIKWPNDLSASGRKLGGILIESRACRDGSRAYIVGIGINCLQQRGHLGDELVDSATSLEIESPNPVDRTALATRLLQELDRWVAPPREWSDGELRNGWLARAGPMGQRVRLQHNGRVFSGSMIDVDPSAALVVQLDEGGVRAFDVASTTVVNTE